MAAVNGRRIGLGPRPERDPEVDAWVRSGSEEDGAACKAGIYTARLTIDVTPELRGRIKVTAFQQGVTVAEMLRGLLVREYDNGEAGDGR
jgi:hypothetical protein